MYLPKHFTHDDTGLAHAAIRAYPFASVVTIGANAEPFVTHAPLALDLRGPAAEQAVLVGHFAAANPHSQLLTTAPQILAIFSGPNAYVSPAHYASKETVPTWNYVAVHAYGIVRIIHDEAAKDASQKRLIADHEPGYAAQWRALDPTYQSKMLGGITVFEIEVTRLEAKFKLSQNRPADDRARVYAHHAAGSPQERGLAQWMTHLGLASPE